MFPQQPDAGPDRFVLHAVPAPAHVAVVRAIENVRLLSQVALDVDFLDRLRRVPAHVFPDVSAHLDVAVDDEPALGPSLVFGRDQEAVDFVAADRTAFPGLVELPGLALDGDEPAVAHTSRDDVDPERRLVIAERLAIGPVRPHPGLVDVPVGDQRRTVGRQPFEPLAVRLVRARFLDLVQGFRNPFGAGRIVIWGHQKNLLNIEMDSSVKMPVVTPSGNAPVSALPPAGAAGQLVSHRLHPRGRINEVKSSRKSCMLPMFFRELSLPSSRLIGRIEAEPVKPLAMNLHWNGLGVFRSSTKLLRYAVQEFRAVFVESVILRKIEPGVVRYRIDTFLRWSRPLPNTGLSSFSSMPRYDSMSASVTVAFRNLGWRSGQTVLDMIKVFMIIIQPGENFRFSGFRTTASLARDTDDTMLPMSLSETWFARATISTCSFNGSRM